MKKRSIGVVLCIGLICCAAMAWVDGVLQPGYAAKSFIKLMLFLLLPLGGSCLCPDIKFLSLLRPKKKGLGICLGLGLGIYGLILGGYFLIGPYFVFSSIAGALTENAGVTKDYFLWVSLYISFVNSFLEEFFFRGFLFTNLKGLWNRPTAYGISCVLFAGYHVAMMLGWFSPVLFCMIMAGLMAGGAIFNHLNERLDTIYCSWLTHMFANFAINTIGFLLLK